MKNVEKEIGGKTLTLETGKIARQSAGSIVLTYGETVLLVAVNAAKEAREDIGYFPLQVEYREKHYASGKIPGGFFKREARPTEGEVLTSRLTDRPIRPLFPKSFKNETQVMVTVLQSDGENLSDTWAGVGASAALLISNIPWNGPIATVRVGLIGSDFIFNPTREQLDECLFEMVVSGNKENIVMVEGEAKEVKEDVIIEGLKYAHKYILEIISVQEDLASMLDISKMDIHEVAQNAELDAFVKGDFNDKIDQIVKITDKVVRNESKSELTKAILSSANEKFPDQENEIKSIIDALFKESMREMILSDGVRSDGRATTDIREITIDPSILKRVHGSALFTRGETQALVVTTLGSKRDEMIIDSMDEDYKKNYYLHYNFPPYCVGEVGRIGFTSRREIGHGNLAQRAIKPVLPDYDDFPYTIRIVSEIMESNG
ncbi:polyribonucleotide nucleotidyltransferase, partial [bacterium]|nr:polyribonucleotide nucleotidyltransferase [bacterium]